MEKKFTSSGVVIIRRENDQYVYLLLRAYQHWDFPKGVVEKGETPFDAALREVNEETTITDLTFSWGYEFIETGPYGKGKVARYYLASTERNEIELPINPEIGVPEHEEYCWVSADEAKKMITPRVRAVLEWAQKYLI
jgi:bis(5'-nucleosidyl)-tetraphosphatase